MLAAFAALNPAILASIPKAQCSEPDGHRLHLGRRAAICSTCEIR